MQRYEEKLEAESGKLKSFEIMHEKVRFFIFYARALAYMKIFSYLCTLIL